MHVPTFPVNLVSMSHLIDDLGCRVTIDRKIRLIQERHTMRKLGTGTKHNGLRYMDREVPNHVVSMVLE